MRTLPFLKIPKNLEGTKVLLRVDFNEPVHRGVLADSYRIRITLPTIHWLLKAGAKVILVAHLEDEKKKQLSFASTFKSIQKLLKRNIRLVKNYSREEVGDSLARSGVVLMENVRFNKGEEKNDLDFARRLASFGDIYINEAFSASHRVHASIVGITRFLPSFAGFHFQKEVEALGEALSPSHPFLLIIGGAKFSTKYPLLKSFLARADAIFVGGALANTFLKAHGIEIGKSIHDKDAVGEIQREFLISKKIFFPLDARISHQKTKDIYKIEKNEGIYDVGSQTTRGLVELAGLTKLIVWNGPLGYTGAGYFRGTLELLRGFAKLKNVKIILGGGDTLEVLDKTKLHKNFFHISTGGGAMLDFLADGTLPGIEAIVKSQGKSGL